MNKVFKLQFNGQNYYNVIGSHYVNITHDEINENNINDIIDIDCFYTYEKIENFEQFKQCVINSERLTINDKLTYLLNMNGLKMNDENLNRAIDYIIENYDTYANNIEQYINDTLKNNCELFE